MELKDIELANEAYILPRYQTILKKQNITTAYDILYNFPSRYEDYNVSSIKDAVLDQNIVLEGTVSSKVSVNYLKSKLSTVVFTMDIEGEKIRCTVFNRIYLKNKINFGTVMRIEGHFYQNMNNFTVSNLIICDEVSRNIVPVYHVKEIAGDKYLTIVDKVFRRYKHLLRETLPEELMITYNLPSITDTIHHLHLADTMEEIEKGIRRIKFEELLEYQLSMRYLHYMRTQATDCPVINYDENLLKELESKLPYTLTEDQKSSIKDILKDLKSTYSMNRLLQGEVGSGKTIVAAFAILATVSDGFQAALMCPTEILSEQHFESFKEIIELVPNVKMAILTGSTPASERVEVIKGLKNGTIHFVIGTHALFQDDVEYHNLGLVVTDEEHRFGVHQRVLIKNKGQGVNYLKMSATPIPRSLAISYYGDTDISIIKTMPQNRKPVITKFVRQEDKQDVVNHMKAELAAGHQIYVVTPLIDESESIDTANANESFERMKKYFKGAATVGLIHGKLKSEEKEQIMKDFLDNKIQILVATSVIEVGVNVKNATTILILGAERFGVATLHQLRGRVMRSDNVPYCFLIPENLTDNAEERLKMVENTSDGFALAEYDLLSRGPGEFFGERQTGSMEFHYANLLKDKDILHEVLDLSNEIVESGKLFNNDDYAHLLEVVKHNYEMKINDLD